MSQRREQAKTDETTLSEGLARNLALERISNFAHSTGLDFEEFLKQCRPQALILAEDQAFTKAALEDAKTPLEVLKRTLSTRSVLSTNSSFAERMEAQSHMDTQNMIFTEIGRGSFGTVFEIPGTEWCLKKTLVSRTPLKQEFSNGSTLAHFVNVVAWKAIAESAEFEDSLMPRVPQYAGSYGLDASENPEDWFRNNGHMFPKESGGQKPGPFICLERVLPLPKTIRRNLILHYFKPEDQQAALEDAGNKSCICRAYLGNRSTDIPKDKREQELGTLKNFPLYLDQLQELDMDPFSIARDMALGLAAGHWAARIDMLDVEYVIGSRPHEQRVRVDPIPKVETKGSGKTRRGRKSGAHILGPHPTRTFRDRAIQLWIIDFNKASPLDCSVGDDYRKNIQQLVCNTRSTDGPYYPRVLARDTYEWKLWLEFARTYINASRTILRDIVDYANGSGIICHPDNVDLILKRPSRVMDEWVKAEAQENGLSKTQFFQHLKENGWDMA